MTELKFYVTLSVPSDTLSDEYHTDTMSYITEAVQEIADGLCGSVEDLEIK